MCKIWNLHILCSSILTFLNALSFLPLFLGTPDYKKAFHRDASWTQFFLSSLVKIYELISRQIIFRKRFVSPFQEAIMQHCGTLSSLNALKYERKNM